MDIYRVRDLLRTRSFYDLDLRVVYYARVSTDKEEQKTSIQNQRDCFEELITKNRHWTFCGGYIDDGISGISVEKREAFQRMIQDARDGEFDLIVTKEISRFARNTLDSIKYTRELTSCGVCVWFQNDNINTIDSDSEFRLTIMAGIAQDESRKMSDRLRFGFRQAIKSGRSLGVPPLGYNSAKGKLTVREDEAKVVRFLFETYASGHYSLQEVADMAAENGYMSRKGRPFCQTTINGILKNEKYKGLYVGGKNKKESLFSEKKRKMPIEDCTVLEGVIPAIVPENVWDMANELLKERGDHLRERDMSLRSKSVFCGKIFCKKHGCKCWMAKWSSRNPIYAWQCSERNSKSADACPNGTLLDVTVRKAVAEAVNEAAGNVDQIAAKYLEILRSESETTERKKTAKIRELNEKTEIVRAKMDKLLEHNLSGAISDDEYCRMNRGYEEKLLEIKAQLAACEKNECTSQTDEQKILAISEELRSYAGISPDDITRRMVDNIIQAIYMDPVSDAETQLTIEFKGLTSERIVKRISKERISNRRIENVLN